MYIKAVKNNYTNIRNEKFEVGKEFKNDGYHFTDGEHVDVVANNAAYGGSNLLKTRFLEIEPISEIYGDFIGEYLCDHIKILREIPISEIKELPAAENLFGYLTFNGIKNL